MQVFYGLNEFIKTKYSTSVALGFFDGVHLGHQQVIQSCVSNSENLKSVVFTFTTPPAKSFNVDTKLLTSNDKKIHLINNLGVDFLIFEDFQFIKDLSPQDFVKKILVDKLHAKKVYTGFNYHFGKGGTSNTKTLHSLCDTNNISSYIIDPIKLDDEIISSTTIRELISNGEIEKANKYLGYTFSIDGIVTKGAGNGKSFNTPTINIPIENNIIIPRLGVYKSYITLNDIEYVAATNIGIHPTIGNITSPLCESFLLNYNGEDIYNKKISAKLISFIRDEKKFNTIEELKSAIKNDIEKINSET